MEKTAIEVIGSDKCTSCFGCYNVCPIPGAIVMGIDSEGFFRPITTEKCIKCGICQGGCPVVHSTNVNGQLTKIYAAWSLNDHIRVNSSSGGIFSEVAGQIIKENGVVYGVGWDNGRVRHLQISHAQNIQLIRKSKYLQSNVGNSYKDIKQQLGRGRKVFFVGTPCQVAALNKIIRDKKNLLTADLVCHGVPSLKAFEKYTHENFKKKIEKVDFRNKKTGWSNYSVVYYSANGVEKKTIFRYDKFFYGFLKDIFLNKACYNCEFSTFPREGDLTLGDFWGVPSGLKNEKGVSVLTVNNTNGIEIVHKIHEAGRVILREIDFNTATKGNMALYNGKIEIPIDREAFFSEIDMKSFDELSNSYFMPPSKFKYQFERVIRGIARRLPGKYLKR